jgi:lactate permease
MFWYQDANPLNNVLLAALAAVIPIIFLFIALAILKMKGHAVGLITLLIAFIISITVFTMPVKLALLSSVYGILFGLLPIGWIVLMAVFLYNITVETGQFKIIKDSITGITDDRRLQAILIAFSFGAFLEAIAGFGTPVAITAAMLVGLGFNPFYSAGICLIANTAPVAFAAVGIPIITAGVVSGIDPVVIGQVTAMQLTVLSIFVPFWLVMIMSGWKGMIEVLPAILVAGLSYGLTLLITAYVLGPTLPGILAALFSMISLMVLFKYWKPENTWKFKEEAEQTLEICHHRPSIVLKAWSPFIILTILITDWGLSPVKGLLEEYSVQITFTGLDKMIIAGDKLIEVVYNFNWLATVGTSILFTTLITAIIFRFSLKNYLSLFLKTINQLKYALVTIASLLGFAYLANWSGMTAAMGKAFIITGSLYPFISPFLGWLGVLITGSDTASNALFSNIQKTAAEIIDVNPVLTVSANSTGGCTAKMISPQSIVVATSSTGLSGQEAKLFRFTIPHSIIFVVLIGLITVIQAYLIPETLPLPVDIQEVGLKYSANIGIIILATSFLLIFLLSLYLITVKNTEN